LRLWFNAAVSIAMLWAALVIPAHFSGATPSLVPLEIPIVLIGLTVLTQKLAACWRWTIILGIAGLTLLRLADAGSRAAFGRAFSPIAEWHLIGQGWTLASRTVGRNEALLVVAIVLLSIATFLWFLSRGLRSFERLPEPARKRTGLGAALLLGGGVALAQAMGPGSVVKPGIETATDFRHRYNAMARAVVDQNEFTEQWQVDPLDSLPTPQFDALEGRDVIVLMVESYGRTWLDTERYRDTARATLTDITTSLSEAGFHSASAWVESPIRGGRSWLAQATFASGLALTNHARFDRLIGTDRKPIHGVFRDAGWTSSVVLPVVKGEWVEGAWYDVDRFFDGPSMGFKGVPQGYVTMPDQYTLSAFQHKVRETADKPLFVTIGLLGTHAPWGPLVLPVDWDLVGDGSVFDGSHRFGRPFSWARPEPVRVMYGRSLELSMPIIGEYIERYGENALILIMGDHQPASVIAGWAPDAAVPLHVVSDSQELLSRLDSAQFTPGMIPADEHPLIPMQSLRKWLSTTFE
jgi:hypothetical protein